MTRCRRRITLLVLPLTAVALLAAGCGASGGGGGAVKIATTPSLKFMPAQTTVRVGQSVEWRNADAVPHNIVAKAGAQFRSATVGEGQDFIFTPEKPGSIRYVCTLHPGMTGVLRVVA